MKTHQSKNKPQKQKSLIAVLVIVIAIISGVTIWYLLQQHNNTTTQDQTNNIKQDATNDAENKQDFLDNEEGSTDKTPDTLTDPTKPNNDTSTTPSNSMISLSAKTESGSVVVTTNLSTISSGTCTLTITGGSSTVTKTAEVIFTPEYSSCAGFSVAKTEVNAPSWTIRLDIKTSNSLLTKTITFTP